MEVWSENCPAATLELRSRLQSLQSQSYSSLAALPPRSTVHATVDGSVSSITTYRNATTEGQLRIVIQIYIPRRRVLLFQFAHVVAEGFTMRQDGRIEVLAEDELFQYK